MVRAGWGVVYTAAGAQYGGWGQPAFLEAQAEAQYVFVLRFAFSGPISDRRAYTFNQGRRGGVCGMQERTSRRLQSTRNGIVLYRRRRAKKSQKRNWRSLNLNDEASLTGYLDEESKKSGGWQPLGLPSTLCCKHDGIIHKAAM